MQKLSGGILFTFALLGVFIIGSLVGPRLLGLIGVTFIGERQLNAATILTKIQQLSTLTTSRYNFSTVVTSQRDMPSPLQALYGESLAMVAVGHVTAGVDLSSLSREEIELSDSFLEITLPAAQLQDCFLNESASYIIERNTGLFNRSITDLESSARQYAINQFRDFALAEGILRNAENQARIAIEQLIALTDSDSIREVLVTFKPADPAAPLPASCGG
ncbi:MAG TPA: DUF4230 domain-containing protein [Aggregatilineales bacterium]|nr:DUF4230 domain-containing protein [Aggregatilineales bacterium]